MQVVKVPEPGHRRGVPAFSRRLRPMSCSPGRTRPIAVDYPGYPVITLHPIEGLEFVEGAVTALGSSTELATHLFPGGVRWRVIPARYSPSRQVPTEFRISVINAQTATMLENGPWLWCDRSGWPARRNVGAPAYVQHCAWRPFTPRGPHPVLR
jgi:hypothetical protein